MQTRLSSPARRWKLFPPAAKRRFAIAFSLRLESLFVSPMNVRESRSGAVVVLTLSGKLDGFSAPALEVQITRILSEGVKHVVFDCSGLEYISSAGLRVF